MVAAAVRHPRGGDRGQQEFAELHAKHWPECEMVATLRQISDEAPEASDA